MARLKDIYNSDIKGALQKELGIKNVMAIPRISKIVVNMGVGEASQNAKLLDGAVSDMTAITGQKPVITKARKSVANFKLREGMGVGCRVTLRGEQMWEFFDRLVNVALPRIRDFKGI
ncbi:MAG: 50S ribosomal protein L5, partial [Mariprofundaceae bacterium]|nr:50S ribosomal protein L5 [Mariprofundaceae bacterium]